MLMKIKTNKMKYKSGLDHISSLLVITSLFTGSYGSIPTILQNPLNNTVVRNEPVTLDCRASGSPNPVIEWFKDGQIVKTAPEDPSSHRILLPDGSLFFLRAMQNKKEQDAGTYWCVASNTEGVARSSNATLDIAYMREEFRATPKDTDAVLEEDVVLECSPPKGHPKPVVKWKKDGDNLDLTSAKRIKIDESGNLVIYKAQKKDQGRYQCTAENVASTKTSKPMRLKVHDPPFFVNKPKPMSVVAGDDVLIECQASGDPHPDIVWTREDKDIDISKIKIIHGKGLRLDNIHPSDEGTYICTAKNIVGVVTSSAKITVLERPVISVQPPNSVQVQRGERVQLDCFVTGQPQPLFYWSKESNNDVAMFPGNTYGDISVTKDGSLVISSTDVEHTGHYTCSVVNEVGSAITRSHLLVYDPSDFKSMRHSEIYHNIEDLDMNEARLASMEKGVNIKSAFSISPVAIKVNWEFVASHKYLQGYRIWHKKSSSPSEAYVSIPVMHSEATSFVINRLEEHTEYDILVQPFYKSVIGRPAAIVTKILTHQDVPSMAPKISKARLYNASTMLIGWESISYEEHNGPLIGYEIVIKGNGTTVNQTIDPSLNEITLFMNGMAINQIYTIVIAAVNKMGKGPFSDPPLEIEIDPFNFINPGVIHENSGDEAAQITLIIAIVSALTLVLIAISTFFFCKWKCGNNQKPSGYLAASTSDDFHCQLNLHSGPIIRNSDIASMARGQKDSNLWIDRGWNGTDYEKESDSSEKKLLGAPQTISHTSTSNGSSHSNSNSDTEYAYVDRHNVSSFTNSSCGGKSRAGGAESPEPYATSDIFQHSVKAPFIYKAPGSHQQVYNQTSHYAAPMLPVFLASKEAQSCDDLSNNSSRSNGSQPLYHHGSSQQKASTSGKRRQTQTRNQVNNRSIGAHGTKSIDMPPRFNATSHSNQNNYTVDYKPKNILDMLPPPPVHPPPPSTPSNIHNSRVQQNTQNQHYQSNHTMSQESVISPKYLFQHPLYRGSSRQSPVPGTNSNRLYRVRPVVANQYEDPRLMIPKEAFYAPNERNGNVHNLNDMQQPHNIMLSNKRINERNNDFDRDFQNELQSFHEAVTQFVASSSNEGCNMPYSQKLNYYMSSEKSSSAERKRTNKDNNTMSSQHCEPEFNVDDDADEDYDKEECLSSNFDHHQDSDASSSDNESGTGSHLEKD